LPTNEAYFRALSKLGNRLVALHLLDETRKLMDEIDEVLGESGA
jgi:hypothetical protein